MPCLNTPKSIVTVARNWRISVCIRNEIERLLEREPRKDLPKIISKFKSNENTADNQISRLKTKGEASVWFQTCIGAENRCLHNVCIAGEIQAKFPGGFCQCNFGNMGLILWKMAAAQLCWVFSTATHRTANLTDVGGLLSI